LAYANSAHEQRNKRTERTQAQHANLDSASELSHTNNAGIKRWKQQSEIGNSQGKLANTENSGDVWRNWVMGFAQEEHNYRGGQSNGRREWWQAEPNVGRVADGVACRVDRLKAIGNGQVPLCAATAWRTLSELL
jgi:DNA (cytosine-5)-methyltransferase 1